MTTNKPTKDKKKFPMFATLIAVAVIGVVATIGGFAYAANQESHDPFCASCHTQPETTFFQRSTSDQATDLASYHTTQKTLCIDCHSGSGVFGRMQAELLGARNAALWTLNAATQPAPLAFPIKDENCIKCHQNVLQRGYVPKLVVQIQGSGNGRREEGKNNHWHELMSRWQATDSKAGSCVSCHSGHATDGTAKTGFQIVQTSKTVCDSCHRAIRRGD